MGFAGNLRTLSLSEVLQTLNRIKANGVLRLASTDGGRDVVFSDGELIGLSFRGGGDHKGLLGLLVVQGKIKPEDAVALSGKGDDPVAVIDSLIGRGLIGLSDAQDAMKSQTIDEMYNLGTWPHGDFVFHEAGPEEVEAHEIVENFRKHPLNLNLNSLLLESAKRVDDWQRIKTYFTDEDQVLAAVQGQDDIIAKAATAYPGSAVVTMIDGIHSVDEIVRNSTAPRFDVYSVLLDLMNLGAIRPLEHTDFLEHAKFLFEHQHFDQAALLYSKALTRAPQDNDSAAQLDQCLMRATGFPGEAECHSKLALSYLSTGAPERAIECAGKSVALKPDDTDLRMSLVRCLIEQGKTPEAVEQLRQVAKRFLAMDRLEDARGTCLKILELDPNNLEVHRELSRIFSQAARDPASEDVVICVQCGEVNHRENAACSSCKAQLQLTCTKCNRVVSVSDRLCIFCGSDPHVGTERHARAPAGSPGTSRIVDTARVRKAVQEKGSKVWRAQLEQHLKDARAYEASDELEKAISEWKEVAKLQVDSPELTAHIRQLENLAHEQFIETAIERGHQLRRNRCFFRACKSYKNALSALSNEDPRYARLKEILGTARGNHRRIAAIYATSFMALGIISFMVVLPHWEVFQIKSEATADRIVLSARQPGLEDMAKVRESLSGLDRRAKAMGSGKSAVKAQNEVAELRADFIVKAADVGAREIEAIRKILDDMDVDTATQKLMALPKALGDDYLPNQLKALRQRADEVAKRKQEIVKQSAEAPQRRDEAIAFEEKGELQRAFALYQALAAGANSKIATEAKVGLERLEPAKQQYLSGWESVGKRVALDLKEAEKLLEALEGDSRKWDNESEHQKLRADIRAKLDAAVTQFRKVQDSRDPDVYDQFTRIHPATPQATEARIKAQQLRSASNQFGKELDAFKSAMSAKAYEDAWKKGCAIHRNANYAPDIKPGEILLPLHLTSRPSGANVTIDGQDKGKTPLMITYDPNKLDGSATFSYSGFQPVTKPLNELTTDWQKHLVLLRQATWSKKHGEAPYGAALCMNSGTIVINIGDELLAIDQQGGEIWRKPASSGEKLADESKPSMRHSPIELPSGNLAFAMSDQNVCVVDDTGSVVKIYQTIQPVGRPAAYEGLFRQSQRIAFAAEALFFAEIGGDTTTFKLPDPAISGPVVLTTGDKQLTVVANSRGHLVAFNESDAPHKAVWDLDLRANDVGLLLTFVQEDKVAIVTVLDGNALACYAISADSAETRWSENLKDGAFGDPVLSQGTAYIASGSVIIAKALSGAKAKAIQLPAPATSPVTVRGECMAVGCGKDLVVFKNEQPAWSTPVTHPITSVCLSDDLVIAGQSDGTLVAFKP
jgi:outer membrane protein assembly factor BamB